MIQLTEAGYKTVMDTLKNPPPVTDKAKAAAESYKKAPVKGLG
jgi:uncharacterized protein (DUF1778 family)